MSTYSDLHIEKEVKAGRLITSNFKSVNLHQACYELRMSDVYYDLSEDNIRIQVPLGGKILIKPLHRVVLITKETLDIPEDVIARITSKGSLFSVGLSPVSTYADPGFSGQIGVVTQNISDRYIELPVGESIAKVEFSSLTEKVREPYQGQHGFQTSIWPIKTQLQRDYSDVRGDPRVRSELIEAYRVTPRATGQLMQYLYKRQRWVLGVAALCLISNAVVLLTAGSFLNNSVALIINILSSLIVTGVALFQRPPWE